MSPKKFTKKELIIALIRDDLMHTKLVEGLYKLELCSGGYLLNLSDTIFKLFGFPEDNSSEEDFLFYIHKRKQVKRFSKKSVELFDSLARELYWDLYYRSPKQARAKTKKNRPR